MDDRQMIGLFFERSEQAITAVSDKYGSLFKRVAADILGSGADAEEAVNDLYLALWNNIPPEKPENFKAYAVRILRNIAIKRFHASKAHKRDGQYNIALEEIAPYLPGPDTPESLLDARELTRILNRFLAGLPKQDRIFFVRRYYLAQSPAQIAKDMGKTSQYISVRLYRVREKLKECLNREGISV